MSTVIVFLATPGRSAGRGKIERSRRLSVGRGWQAIFGVAAPVHFGGGGERASRRGDESGTISVSVGG